GRFDRLPALAAELVADPVAVIVALSPPAAVAAKAATSLACDSEVGFRGLMRKPITLALGNSSRSNSNRFGHERVDKKRHARDVAAGTIETGNETEFHGIGASRENDWDSVKRDATSASCLFGPTGSVSARLRWLASLSRRTSISLSPSVTPPLVRRSVRPRPSRSSR